MDIALSTVALIACFGIVAAMFFMLGSFVTWTFVIGSVIEGRTTIWKIVKIWFVFGENEAHAHFLNAIRPTPIVSSEPEPAKEQPKEIAKQSPLPPLPSLPPLKTTNLYVGDSDE